MPEKCQRCGQLVEQLIPLGNAETSAQYSALLELPNPQYDHLCPTCVVDILAIPKEAVQTSTDGSLDELHWLLEQQKDLMIAVSTGGPKIDEVNGKYKLQRKLVRDLLVKHGLKDPIPYADLWAWYGKWSSGDLPTYRSRRQYIIGLFQPLFDAIENAKRGNNSAPESAPTGWTRVDRGIDAIRQSLESAVHEENFQTVGLLCRETITSLAQAVFDPTRHRVEDDVEPSATDAKRMLGGYFNHELAGGTNEAARTYARASLRLANELTHKRTASFRDAALCAEATRTLVNIVAIISGRSSSPDNVAT